MKSRILRWGDNPRLLKWACDLKKKKKMLIKGSRRLVTKGGGHVTSSADGSNADTSQEMLQLPERERQGGIPLLRHPGE